MSTINVFSYPPLTDDFLDQQSGIIPTGDYPFRVTHCEFRISQSGNNVAKLTLAIINNSNQEQELVTYLSNSRNALYRIRQFWESVGHNELSFAKEVKESDFEDKHGMCRVEIVSDPQYGRQSKVTKFLKPSSSDGMFPPKNNAALNNDNTPIIDDPIPF